MLWILQLFVSLLHQPNCKLYKLHVHVTLLQENPGYKGEPFCLVCQIWKTCQLLHHIAALSLSRNVLTVTVCLTKASAYLTGGDVTIFTLHALIGFSVKYSMVFLRFFCSCQGFTSFGCRLLCSTKTPKSFCFLSCTETILKLRSLVLKQKQLFVPSFVVVAWFVRLKSLSLPSLQSAVP